MLQRPQCQQRQQQLIKFNNRKLFESTTQQFLDISNGDNPTRFTDKDFESLAGTKEARATHAGGSTLKRAAIAHTFIRAQGAGRQLLLEQLSWFSSQRLKDTQLNKIFYSRSNPLDNLRPDLNKRVRTVKYNKVDAHFGNYGWQLICKCLYGGNFDLKRIKIRIKN